MMALNRISLMDLNIHLDDLRREQKDTNDPQITVRQGHYLNMLQ